RVADDPDATLQALYSPKIVTPGRLGTAAFGVVDDGRETCLGKARRLLSITRSFGLRLFLFPQARALQTVLQRVVAFMAGILVDVRISRRPGHFAGPLTLPGIWILHGDPVQQRAIAGAREALDHMQVLRRSVKPRLVREVGCIYNQRVAFPMADRVSHP